jgi:diguanylate cyclase (GGDEF)-like protein
MYQHLFDLEEAFSGELDFIHLSKNILIKVIKETSAAAGIVYWFDEAQHEFKLKTLHGIPSERINQITRILRKPEGVISNVQQYSKTICENDLQKSVYLADLANYYQSVMVVPLHFQKQVLGILVLFKQGKTFTINQLKLLNLFAPRVAVRLDNSRLYQLAKETALENARLYINISKLYQQATMDELTGLFNRNFLMQRIKEELKKAWRFKQPLSLIFADLDFFKRVNDEHGHQVGDQLLTEFGTLMKKSVREYDVACRFGGEEFLILLPQTHIENGFELAERLRKKVAKHVFCSGTENLKITASFGLSKIPSFDELATPMDDENLSNFAENLVSLADEALYQAKKSGRNLVIVAHTEEKPVILQAKQ